MGYHDNETALKKCNNDAIKFLNDRARLEHALRTILVNLGIPNVDEIVTMVKACDFSVVEQIGKPVPDEPKKLIPWKCNVGNCGGGKCVHKQLEETCQVCDYPLIEVTTTGFKFCSNPDYLNGCDYVIEPGGER